MQYIGLDIHKKFSYGVIKNKEGNILAEDKLDNNKGQINQFLNNSAAHA